MEVPQHDGEDTIDATERYRTEIYSGAEDLETLSTEKRTELEAEFDRRTAWWSRYLARRSGDGSFRRHWAAVIEHRRVFLSAVYVFAAVSVFLLIQGLGPWNNPKSAIAWCLSFAPVVLAISLLTSFLAARKATSLDSALRERRCPNCGHPGEQQDGRPRYGPAACPGCNLKWPLVPLPLPHGATAIYAPQGAPLSDKAAERLPLPTIGDRAAARLGQGSHRRMRATRWELAARALRHAHLPQHRIETRVRALWQTLPRFGRRRSSIIRPQFALWAGTACIAIGIYELRTWHAVVVGIPLLAAILYACVRYPADTWKLGAIRRARCGPFENARQVGQVSPGLADTLRDRRSTAHMSQLERSLAGRASQLWSARMELLSLALIVVQFSVFSLFVLGASGVQGRGPRLIGNRTFMLLLTVLMALMIALPIFLRLRGRAIRKALLGSITAQRCCDCGYSLAGLADGIDPAQIDGLHTGPARCPECEAPWPLIPPHIPTGAAR